MPLMKLESIRVEAQVRKSFDEGELRRLGENIKQYGLLQPLLVRKDGVLLAGERRYRAMLLAGIREAQVVITEKVLNDSEVRLMQLTENMQRADLSGYEQWQGCAELMGLNPGWQMKDLAAQLHLDPSMVTRLLSPSRCTEAWQEALAMGQVGISDCYAASKLDPQEQARLLALKLSGASRDAIEQAGRKRRNNPGTQAVRVSRIKCPVPGNGATVEVSGEAMSLEEMIEAITELLREARKANEKGLDARTFERVCRDQAKKQ
jgi:ParB family transcriptional regulator, chromosome partitioning protein